MVSITNIATTTTYFVGAYYEVTSGVATKYYYAGSQRIAMRNNSGLKFLVGDHLGSTSLTTDANGTLVSELRYKAWGEVRYESGTTPTKYTYTGQYSYTSDFGLMFYNARWVDVSLGRFVQADSIVSGGAQGYDRYTYGLNNPSRYTDPSGHKICDGANEDGGDCVEWNANYALSRYGIKVVGVKEEDKWKIYDAAYFTGRKLVPYFGGSSTDAFKKVFGDISIKVGKGRGPRDVDGNLKGNCATTGGSISCEDAMSIGNAVHEFFHVFDNHYNALSNDTCQGDPCLASNYLSQDWLVKNNGFKCDEYRCVSHPPTLGGYDTSELFANMGENWVLENIDQENHGFKNNVLGIQMRDWMDISWFLDQMGLR